MYIPKTRKEAIDLKCKDCNYDKADKGTWLQQVESCEAESTCPLWAFRPVTQATLKIRQAEKVAKMNPEQLARFKKQQEAARERLTGTKKGVPA